MKVLNKLAGRLRRISGKKLIVTAALVTTALVAGVATTVDFSAKAAAADCSGNSIIKCGASSRSEFISDVQHSSELQHIYAQFGLTSADYSRFISQAKDGLAYRNNNTIVVDGKVVATNVGSIGRWASYQGSGYRTFVIPGAGTYYGNLNDKSISPSSPSLPVQVLFNSKGQMQFAVMMSSCANPTYGTPTTPPTCKELNATSLGNNKWQFTTSINGGTNHESVNKVVYSFGDGTTATSTSAPYTVQHTFTKNATVTATVYVNVPGGGTAVSSTCQKQITYVLPPAAYACTLLTLTPGKVDNQGNQSYTLAAKASATNATILNYGFDFGDGKTGTVTTGATTASTTHTYAPGSYTAKVSVTVKTNAGKVATVTSAYCAKPLTVKPLVGALSCVNLTLTQGDVNQTTGATAYTLAATASATNATITSYVFHFGDSAANATVTTGATTASTTHTYAPGSYTASVTVNGKDVYGKPLTATAPACSQPVTVKVPSAPNVTITKFVDHKKYEQVAVGQNFVYEVKVTNTGNITLTNVVVTDPAPNGVTMLSTDLGTIASNALSYTIPTLKVGDSVTFNITAKVDAYMAGNIVNTACVNAPEVNPTQPNQPDSCSSATVTVTPPTPQNPNITITKTVDGQKQEQVSVGQQFTYQVIVTNTGEIDLTNVVVTDPAPNGVTMLSTDLGTIASNALSYTIPTLKVGDSVTFNITAKVDAYMAGNIVNTACVNAPEVNPTQPNQPDSCSSATVTVTPPETPTVLPNTGAGNVIGIVGGAMIAGTLAGRLFLSRRLARKA